MNTFGVRNMPYNDFVNERHSSLDPRGHHYTFSHTPNERGYWRFHECDRCGLQVVWDSDKNKYWLYEGKPINWQDFWDIMPCGSLNFNSLKISLLIV